SSASASRAAKIAALGGRSSMRTMRRSRCTDERGEVQPSLAELYKNWGITDVASQKTAHAIHINAIQPWKVDRGTAKEGAEVFAKRCAVCHGRNGEGGAAQRLVLGGPGNPYHGPFKDTE